MIAESFMQLPVLVLSTGAATSAPPVFIAASYLFHLQSFAGDECSMRRQHPFLLSMLRQRLESFNRLNCQGSSCAFLLCGQIGTRGTISALSTQDMIVLTLGQCTWKHLFSWVCGSSEHKSDQKQIQAASRVAWCHCDRTSTAIDNQIGFIGADAAEWYEIMIWSIWYDIW
jgi:hypothetical protein